MLFSRLRRYLKPTISRKILDQIASNCLTFYRSTAASFTKKDVAPFNRFAVAKFILSCQRDEIQCFWICEDKMVVLKCLGARCRARCHSFNAWGRRVLKSLETFVMASWIEAAVLAKDWEWWSEVGENVWEVTYDTIQKLRHQELRFKKVLDGYLPRSDSWWEKEVKGRKTFSVCITGDVLLTQPQLKNSSTDQIVMDANSRFQSNLVSKFFHSVTHTPAQWQCWLLTLVTSACDCPVSMYSVTVSLTSVSLDTPASHCYDRSIALKSRKLTFRNIPFQFSPGKFRIKKGMETAYWVSIRQANNHC